MKSTFNLTLLLAFALTCAAGQAQQASSVDDQFARYALRLREDTLRRVEPPRDRLGWAHLKSSQFITTSYSNATMVAAYIDMANDSEDQANRSNCYALIAYMAGVSQHGVGYAPIEYMPDGRIIKIYLKQHLHAPIIRYLIPTRTDYFLSYNEVSSLVLGVPTQ
jgi:hypothetical protein